MFLALVLLLASFPAAAGELWRGVHTGMSIDQVRAVFPSATVPVEPGTFSSGARTELEVPGPELAGQPFVAEFGFINGRLHHVRLAMTSAMSYAQARGVISSIREALISKYGPPVDWQDKPGDLINNASGTWRSGAVLVQFTVLGIAENPAVVQILYSEPSDAAKL